MTSFVAAKVGESLLPDSEESTGAGDDLYGSVTETSGRIFRKCLMFVPGSQYEPFLVDVEFRSAALLVRKYQQKSEDNLLLYSWDYRLLPTYMKIDDKDVFFVTAEIDSFRIPFHFKSKFFMTMYNTMVQVLNSLQQEFKMAKLLNAYVPLKKPTLEINPADVFPVTSRPSPSCKKFRDCKLSLRGYLLPSSDILVIYLDALYIFFVNQANEKIVYQIPYTKIRSFKTHVHCTYELEVQHAPSEFLYYVINSNQHVELQRTFEEAVKRILQERQARVNMAVKTSPPALSPPSLSPPTSPPGSLVVAGWPTSPSEKRAKPGSDIMRKLASITIKACSSQSAASASSPRIPPPPTSPPTKPRSQTHSPPSRPLGRSTTSPSTRPQSCSAADGEEDEFLMLSKRSVWSTPGSHISTLAPGSRKLVSSPPDIHMLSLPPCAHFCESPAAVSPRAAPSTQTPPDARVSFAVPTQNSGFGLSLMD